MQTAKAASKNIDKRTTLISQILYEKQPPLPLFSKQATIQTELIERTHFLDLSITSNAILNDIKIKRDRIHNAMCLLKKIDQGLFNELVKPNVDENGKDAIVKFPMLLNVPTESLSRDGWNYNL